jgi:hypothetical protein
MAEKRFRLKKVPSVSDAIGLYGFLCPILKMLPYDVYLRVEIEDTGLILETEKHYFDDMYNLSPKTGPRRASDTDTDYVSSLSGSRSYLIDAGSLYRGRSQLQESGMMRKKAIIAFMSRYSKSAILRNAFDSDIKWEADAEGGALLVMTSNNEGDFKRLEKRLVSQFAIMEEERA